MLVPRDERAYARAMVSAVNLWRRQQIEPNLRIVDVRDALELAADSSIGARNLPHDHAIFVQVA
ncbi:hypothetical protein WMF30_32465 [Sorangium sp. So ce134]